MLNMHRVLNLFLSHLTDAIIYVCSINIILRDAYLLVVQNLMLYMIINWFKHMVQASIDQDGPVNTFYYLPLVYEERITTEEDITKWHTVLRTPTWQFLEILFRHHLVLLVPFNLALIVPHCKRMLVSSLMIVSNFALFVCFLSSICRWLEIVGFPQILNALPVICFGPGLQIFLMHRLMSHLLVNAIGNF